MNQLTEKWEEYKSLQSDKEKLLNEQETVRTQTNELLAQVSKMKLELTEARVTLERTKAQAEAESKVIEERESKLEYLNLSIANMEMREATAKSKLDEIEKNIRLRAPEQDALENKLAEIEGQCLGATSKLEQLRDQMKTDMAIAQAEIDSFRQQNYDIW